MMDKKRGKFMLFTTPDYSKGLSEEHIPCIDCPRGASKKVTKRNPDYFLAKPPFDLKKIKNILKTKLGSLKNFSSICRGLKF